MKKIFSTLLFVFTLIFANLAFAADYIMCPGDQLDIIVMGVPEMSTGYTGLGTTTLTPTTPQNKYIVRPDGKVSFQLIGEVDTTGLTVSQFTKVLQELLAKYIVNPQISVNIVQLGTTRVYVFGEVNKPGLYELQKSHNLLDAVGIANGFTKDAAKKNVFLIRRDKQNEPIKLNLNDLLTKGDVSQNYVLGEGDVVYLTSNGRIDFTRDIVPLFSAAYYVNKIKNND